MRNRLEQVAQHLRDAPDCTLSCAYPFSTEELDAMLRRSAGLNPHPRQKLDLDIDNQFEIKLFVHFSCYAVRPEKTKKIWIFTWGIQHNRMYVFRVSLVVRALAKPAGTISLLGSGQPNQMRLVPALEIHTGSFDRVTA